MAGASPLKVPPGVCCGLSSVSLRPELAMSTMVLQGEGDTIRQVKPQDIEEAYRLETEG